MVMTKKRIIKKVFVVYYENQAELNVYKLKIQQSGWEKSWKMVFTKYSNQGSIP